MADLAVGQQRLRREGEWFAGLHIGLHRRPHRLQPVGSRIRAGQHGQHSGRGPRRGRVDAIDPRMGVRRAQHDGMRQAVEAQIVEIGAVAGDEARILPAPGRIADHRALLHWRLPIGSRPGRSARMPAVYPMRTT